MQLKLLEFDSSKIQFMLALGIALSNAFSFKNKVAGNIM